MKTVIYLFPTRSNFSSSIPATRGNSSESLYMNQNVLYVTKGYSEPKTVYRTDNILVINHHRPLTCVEGIKVCKYKIVPSKFGWLNHYR